ncbi:MAG: IS1634 family transposase [Sulfuricaulis sp.]|uniref:IS1634 family transposase n=1 Tax=Sulfuricaulis sp. TaxID=2003553 RepID=UPI003C572BA7
MFFRVKQSQNRKYLQIVENRREGGKVKQRVIGTVGRLDRLEGAGQLESLLESGARLTESILLINAHQQGEAPVLSTKRIGAVKIFERLWSETGCRQAIQDLLTDRKFDFPLERAIFLTVLHRVLAPGSDRSAERWREDYAIDGMDGLELHHLYRAMMWLGEEIPDQAGSTGFSPRCVKDLIEEALFARRRDLFSELEMVFFDTTSLYFEGEGGETIGQRGYSKDHRPDLKQMVVGAVLDESGRPVCCELWPGSTTDVKTLLPLADRLSRRFGVQRACLVADRGMISQETIDELERRHWPYILGARMRKQKEVSKNVLSRAGRYHEVREPGQDPKGRAPLKVKQVMVDQRRYIVCLNEAQAKKDAADREAIVAALQEQLKKGDKSRVGNRGYRQYLKTGDGPHFEIDQEKIKAEARYDGKWVLRANTDLSASDVALKYKQLWQVESLFRDTKSLLETRPIFHQRDDTIRGHVFCSFLALILRKALLERLDDGDDPIEWQDLLRDLESLQHVDVAHQGKRFRLRTEARGCSGRVFQRVGVALPPTVQQIKEASLAS